MVRKWINRHHGFCIWVEESGELCVIVRRGSRIEMKLVGDGDSTFSRTPTSISSRDDGGRGRRPWAWRLTGRRRKSYTLLSGLGLFQNAYDTLAGSSPLIHLWGRVLF